MNARAARVGEFLVQIALLCVVAAPFEVCRADADTQPRRRVLAVAPFSGTL